MKDNKLNTLADRLETYRSEMTGHQAETLGDGIDHAVLWIRHEASNEGSPYAQGIKAFREGMCLADNPFREPAFGPTDYSFEWDLGWNDEKEFADKAWETTH